MNSRKRFAKVHEDDVHINILSECTLKRCANDENENVLKRDISDDLFGQIIVDLHGKRGTIEVAVGKFHLLPWELSQKPQRRSLLFTSAEE